jgi:ribonuclease-3
MYKKLYEQINYSFKNEDILDLVFTHKSSGESNNERLEFLGDAILGAVISEELYNRFTNISEGELTRIRASLVRGTTLMKKGRELELLSLAKLSKAAKNLSDLENSSILGTIFEALVGGIYLDSSWDEAKVVILSLYRNDLESIDIQNSFKDPKSELQEYLQSLGEEPLKYICEKSHNGSHDIFECYVVFNGNKFTDSGKSKKKAQMKVADKILRSMK